MARTARQISNLVIDEISLVDKGANQHAVVTIAKSADGENKENEMEIFDEQGNPLDVADLNEGDVVYDMEGNPYQMELDSDGELGPDEGENDGDADDDGVEKRFGRKIGPNLPAGRRIGRAAGKFGSSARGAASSARSSFSAGVGGGQAVRALHSAQGGSAKVARGAAGRHVGNHPGAYGALAGGGGVAALGGGGAVVYNRNRSGVGKSYADEVRDELSKALTDKDREEVITKALGQVGYLSEQVEIAKAAAEQERTLRVEREYTEIAKSYNLPFEDNELGRVLMHCAEALPAEDCEIIHKAFEAAGAAVFDEYGLVGGGDNADVYSQVEAAIDAQVSKSGVTREEAMAEFFDANPEAYDEYLAERY